MLVWLATLTAVCATSVFAAPPPGRLIRDNASHQVPASDLQGLIPTADQTQLIPPSTDPIFVALGVGVQNYTCANGTFSNIGAVAQLFDISCLYGTPEWDTVQSDAYAEWSATSQPAERIININGVRPPVLGQHYFIANPAGTGANVPKFDFTSGFYNGNPDAFAIGSKAGDVVSPDNTAYIDWLMLNVVSGELATQIFRVSTVEGKAASSCASGDTSSVKYTAKYYFYGTKL